ncbi:MAG: ABC transporter ATP-binding protein [Pirellulaceae bacterium]|nr:ABC transporter ATP-binding protein [Pirellulaceae bacterium]
MTTTSRSRQRFAEYRRRIGRRAPDDQRAGGQRQRRQRSFTTLLAAFYRLLRGHRLSVAIGLATLTVATILRLLPPLATKLVIDHVLDDRPLPDSWPNWLPMPAGRLELLFWLAGGVALISLLATAVHLWGRWYATLAVNRMQAAIRRQVFAHAVRLPLHRVYQIKSGGAASMLREDAGGVGDLIFSMVYNPWRAIIQLVGSLAVLVWVDWRLLLGGTLLLPVVYLTHRTWVNRIRPLYRDIRAQRQDIDSHATEAFGGMRVVRTFGRERSETNRFTAGNHLLIRQQLFVWWWTRLIEIIWDVLIPLASTVLLLYGGYRVLTGHLTVGDLTMFLVYLAMLLSPLATLATSATMFQNSLAGLERVLDLLEEPLESARLLPGPAFDPGRAEGRLAFEHVEFRYPGSQEVVLHDICLTVEPGETVALVGRSGAGKTTLCNLVARFYEPPSGRLTLDGHDLRTIPIEAYRRLLGIVEQDVFLFDGTIAQNIAYADRRATADDIRQAAQAAHADDFIRQFEHGYATVIGERGVRLSGGQRQRLAIARALLANPRILILDEATSNLDSESERLIQQSLATLMRGRTSFVIAHRLSTIVHADRIVVLDQGRIAEVGTHRQLLAGNGIYRQMVELQMGSD